SGSRNEKDLLDQFSKSFAEFQRIDKDLLDLAVKNSNVKASNLTFGPAAAALHELDTALARLMTANAADVKIIRLADDARIAALRIQVLLPPHIAEESDSKMDEMEALMAVEDRTVRKSLADLATVPNLSDNPDLQTATSSYNRFSELRTQILKLSRENTNVRSLTISLNQKRKVTLVCQDALAALKSATEQEPIAPAPVSPR
ncbi:MAG TPA: MCP four helix bundle domain-containing protein, partial [Pyrinomonadaceae bacterium]